MIRPTRFEILGMPGAGKSTVADELAARGTATLTTWAGPGPGRGMPVAVRLFLQAPVVSALAYLTVATRRRVRRVHVRRVLSVQRRHVIARSNRSAGVVALDEGPVHALFITLYGTGSTALSRLLLRRVLTMLARHVDHYVHLDVPKEQCIENFLRPGRTSARFRHTSTAATLQEFREDTTYDEILDALRLVTRGQLLVVDSVAAACTTISAGAVTPARPHEQDAG